MHGGLRFFERELVAVHLELPGDIYMLDRMLRVGVRFAMLDEVVLDYFPSALWEPSTVPAASHILAVTERRPAVAPRPPGATGRGDPGKVP
jgi:hypothetical protein